MEGEHRGPIDGCRVPYGRWRQSAGPDGEEMAYTRRMETVSLKTEGRDVKDGTNGEYCKRLLQCNTAMLKCRTG